VTGDYHQQIHEAEIFSFEQLNWTNEFTVSVYVKNFVTPTVSVHKKITCKRQNVCSIALLVNSRLEDKTPLFFRGRGACIFQTAIFVSCIHVLDVFFCRHRSKHTARHGRTPDGLRRNGLTFWVCIVENSSGRKGAARKVTASGGMRCNCVRITPRSLLGKTRW